MQDVEGKVAVVTGAASGIGLALATRFAESGMKVVLADVERDALAAATRTLQGAGHAVLAVPTDVSRGEDVEALAARTVAEFGGVHLLCNNAGVSVAGPLWEHSVRDWEWVLGVNLWGVIHGVRVFVPIMLGQDAEGHVVNTASVAGLTSFPMGAIFDHHPKNSLGCDNLVLGHSRDVEFVFVPLGLDDDSRVKPLNR
jgi:NADP-dependent 3-hydroxy acid dehydrogenase YdfG